MRFLRSLFSYEGHGLELQRQLLAVGLRGLKPWLSLLLAAVLALTCRHTVDLAVLGRWLALVLANTGLGLLFRGFFRRRQQRGLSARDLREIEWAGLAYGITTGLTWGSSSQLLVPGQAEHNLVVIMVYLGVCAGAASINIFALGHLLLASAIAAALFLAPMPVIFPAESAPLVVMFALYHAVIIRLSWERNGILLHNLRLSAEKDALLAQSHQQAQRALQANEEKSAFLAAASHDLRQPVHALILTSHALRNRVGTGENRLLVDRILEAGQVLADQFNSLMDLSRLESGAYPVHRTDVALTPLLRQVVSSRQPLAASRGMHLRLRVAAPLQTVGLHTDAQLLARLLGNLLDNAIKFSPDGQGVLVTARRQRGMLRIAVHDRGPGIAPGDLDRIFRPYVQLQNPVRERARGIGLGLSIAREAADCLYAQLGVQSRVGHGSTFTVSMAAPILVAPPAPPLYPAAGPPADATALQGQTLLVVEDDPIAAQALLTLAQDWGLQARHCVDPADVEHEPAPALIVCDIRLPGPRDGIEWLSDWLLRWPEARGVLVSGELLAETHARAEQEGLLLLSKPVDPVLLLRTLSHLAAQPRLLNLVPA